MKSLIKITTIVIVLLTIVSCKKENRPNYQYMPNMYEPVGYETYNENHMFENGMASREPAEGSVPRGFVPFDVDNTIEGYDLAKATLKNPLDSTQVSLDKGGALFNIYCAICHGTKGDGQGNLVKREKILGVPSFDDAGRAVTEGSIYHTIHYGKNTMGSYANQLSIEERWHVVAYVLQLKADLEK